MYKVLETLKKKEIIIVGHFKKNALYKKPYMIDTYG